MNLEKLEVGMIVKNYKVMCELVGEKVEGGNAKKSQLKEWDRYIKYKKSGNKFVIIEIYSEPIVKVDNRNGGNHTIYGDIVQLLLVDMLMNSKDKRVSISKSKLIETLGLANSNYNDCKESLIKLSNFLNIGIEYIYDFYNINDSNFNSIIKNALKSLQDKRIILYETTYKAMEVNSRKTRLMSDYEKDIVLEVEKDILYKYKVSKQSDLIRLGKWKSFKNEASFVIKEKLNISRYYKAYDIHINKKYIESEKCELLDKIYNSFNNKDSKLELNNIVVDNISKNTRKRNEKAESSNGIRGNEEYESNSNALTRVLVKYDSGSIIEAMRKEKGVYEKPKSEIQLKLEYLELDLDSLLPF